jgi:recombination protein RecA
MNEMNKLLGAGTIKMGSDPANVVTYLPTGILPIDNLLNGGLPRGRILEIFGDWASVKSYVALRAIAQTQRTGGMCALVDSEHSFDPRWAESLGVSIGDLLMPTITNGEEAVDASEYLVSQNIDLLVWDSVAATLPKQEQATRLKTHNPQMARLAALMSLGLRKINSANEKTAIMFINQTRMNVGVTFGDPTTTPGGKALPFYASIRLQMKKVGKVNRKITTYDAEGKKIVVNEQIGQQIQALVLKSRLDKPMGEVRFMFDLENGTIDEIGYLIAAGQSEGAIQHAEKSQTWVLDIPGLMTKKTNKAGLRGLVQSDLMVRRHLEGLAGPVVTAIPPVLVLPPARKRVVRRKSAN